MTRSNKPGCKNKKKQNKQLYMSITENVNGQMGVFKKQLPKRDILPCYTWSRTPPACGSATGMQTPCWAAQERTPSP